MVRAAARGRSARPGCGDHHRHRESRLVERAGARHRASDQGRSRNRACPRRGRSLTLRPAHRPLQNAAPRSTATPRRWRPHRPDPGHHLSARREARSARGACTEPHRHLHIGVDAGLVRTARSESRRPAQNRHRPRPGVPVALHEDRPRTRAYPRGCIHPLDQGSIFDSTCVGVSPLR